MIFCREWWPWTKQLYHYDPETKQQSMEWRHIGSPRPNKYSECKNPLEKFLPRFFGIKTVSSSLNIFKRAKLSTRSIIHLCWCNWRAFWRKNAAGSSPKGVLFLHDNAPGSPGICNPEESGLPGLPSSWSTTLFSVTSPVGLSPVPSTEKQLKGHHFSSDAEVIAAAETWLDGQISDFFFEWFGRVRETG